MENPNNMTDKEVLEAFDNIGHFHFNFGNDEDSEKRREEHFEKINSRDISYIREILQLMYDLEKYTE